MSLFKDANTIINYSLRESLPDKAVIQALKQIKFLNGKIFVIAIGKAAWQMAYTASKHINNIYKGIVITKYNHVKHQIPNFTCYEAGHPISDNNTFKATQKVIELCQNLNSNDNIVFLISGGGSALFEYPLIKKEELLDINKQLLECGASITEINAIRKKLSAVKGGKFAKICSPAKIFNIILSDIIGNPLDMIASGPTCLDKTPKNFVSSIIQKYKLNMSKETKSLLKKDLPIKITNTETYVTGSVENLCDCALQCAKNLGYEPHLLTSHLECEAKEAGAFLGAIAKTYQHTNKSIAFIAGGETVVHITGKGKGGRNQEIALSAAAKISNLHNTAIFSVGSDGTDGPTDAAGGFVDNNTKNILENKNIDISLGLQNNDSYNVLKSCNGLIITGPTGTNVNDLSVILIKR